MSLNFIKVWRNDKWYNKRVLIWHFTLVLIKINYGQIGNTTKFLTIYNLHIILCKYMHLSTCMFCKNTITLTKTELSSKQHSKTCIIYCWQLNSAWCNFHSIINNTNFKHLQQHKNVYLYIYWYRKHDWNVPELTRTVSNLTEWYPPFAILWCSNFGVLDSNSIPSCTSAGCVLQLCKVS
jgi:hypothetical protein